MRLLTISICLFLCACGGANDADLFSSTMPEARDGTSMKAADAAPEAPNADGQGKFVRPQKPAPGPDSGPGTPDAEPLVDAGPGDGGQEPDPWGWVDAWVEDPHPETEYAECATDTSGGREVGACLAPAVAETMPVGPWVREGCKDPGKVCVPCWLHGTWTEACDDLGPEPDVPGCDPAWCPDGDPNGFPICDPETGGCATECFVGYEHGENGYSCVPAP